MFYRLEFTKKARKDLHKLPKYLQTRLLDKLVLLQNNLQGDVKRLTNHTPEYRLRVANYRILFEIDSDVIIVYTIVHRKDAY